MKIKFVFLIICSCVLSSQAAHRPHYSINVPIPFSDSSNRPQFDFRVRFLPAIRVRQWCEPFDFPNNDNFRIEILPPEVVSKRVNDDQKAELLRQKLLKVVARNAGVSEDKVTYNATIHSWRRVAYVRDGEENLVVGSAFIHGQADRSLLLGAVMRFAGRTCPEEVRCAHLLVNAIRTERR